MSDSPIDAATPSALAIQLSTRLGEMLATCMDRMAPHTLAEISVSVSLTFRRGDEPALKFTLDARVDDSQS